MNRWEEEKIRMAVYKELGAAQAEEEKVIAEHLVHALYFSSEASKRLRGLIESCRDNSLMALKDTHLDVLCTMKALIDCGIACGLTTQLALLDAQAVIESQIADRQSPH